MSHPFLRELFALDGQVAVVTGATGVLGGAAARALAAAGASVGVLARHQESVQQAVDVLERDGVDALALPADVLDRAQLEQARAAVLARWGHIDILVNGAGGNVADATLAEGAELIELPEVAFREVVDLNLLGTWLPCQAFAAAMADSSPPSGVIVNISSMAAQRSLTRVVGYGAAKAAVENLTRWLASELARRHGEEFRVNAIAPGFFLGEQNRALLVDERGRPTFRGRAILEHTPAGRFGAPQDLAGIVVWLCSPAARFVNGIVIPVDGGFGAFSGV